MSTIYAPLTTTFTAPTECWGTPWAVFGDYVWMKQGGDLNSTCFPPNFNFNEAQDGTVMYSPGICPYGWKSACDHTETSSGTTQTIVSCCPSSYECAVSNPFYDWQVSYGCVTPLATVNREAYNINATANVVSSMFQMQIFIVEAATSTSTSFSSQSTSASPASSPTTNATPTSATGTAAPASGGGGGGMSAGVKAGIAVGVVLGVAILALLGYIAYRLSPKKRTDPEPPMQQYSEAGYPDGPPSTYYHNPQPPVEIGDTNPQKRFHEMDEVRGP